MIALAPRDLALLLAQAGLYRLLHCTLAGVFIITLRERRISDTGT